MSHRAVFITSRPELHRRHALEAAPPEIDITMLVAPEPGEAAAAIATVDPEFLISERTGVVDRAMIESGPNLRLIQRLGRQIHDIDLDAARRAGVPVCFWPLPQLTLVAEHLMMQILTLLKRSRAASHVVAEASDRWGPPRRCDADTFGVNWAGLTGVRPLRSSVVGIIGFGEIGTNLAELLGPFDCTVLYHRRSRLPAGVEETLGITYATVDEILRQSDIVVTLLPHSPETEGSVDESFVGRMRPGSYLVSAGASTLLDETAVAAAYRSGHLAGVATDGHRWEPVRPDSPLVALLVDPAANVTLTPHSAQGDLVMGAEYRRPEFTNVRAVLDGAPLRHRVGGTP